MAGPPIQARNWSSMDLNVGSRELEKWVVKRSGSPTLVCVRITQDVGLKHIFQDFTLSNSDSVGSQ